MKGYPYGQLLHKFIKTAKNRLPKTHKSIGPQGRVINHKNAPRVDLMLEKLSDQLRSDRADRPEDGEVDHFLAAQLTVAPLPGSGSAEIQSRDER